MNIERKELLNHIRIRLFLHIGKIVCNPAARLPECFYMDLLQKHYKNEYVNFSQLHLRPLRKPYQLDDTYRQIQCEDIEDPLLNKHLLEHRHRALMLRRFLCSRIVRFTIMSCAFTSPHLQCAQESVHQNQIKLRDIALNSSIVLLFDNSIAVYVMANGFNIHIIFVRLSFFHRSLRIQTF